MSRYDSEYNERDSRGAEYIRQNGAEVYGGYTDKHLKNALNYSRGCSGSEAHERQKAIKKEITRREKA